MIDLAPPRCRSLAVFAATLVIAMAWVASATAKPRAKARPAKARSAAVRVVPAAVAPAVIATTPPPAPASSSSSSPDPLPPASPTLAAADRGAIASESHDEGTHSPMRVGALAGAGFPHPLALEVMVAPTSRSAFGLEGSLSPAITLAPVTLEMWAVAADARVFPFRGAFFVGARVGFQRLTMRAAMSAPARNTVSVEAIAETAFVNPRIGFLWRTESGLTFGVDAGVSLPVHPTLRAPYPLETPDGVRTRVARVADALGNAPTPSVNLLRVGMLF